MDADTVDGARAGLAASGCENVQIILGDGTLGYPGGALYNRIIAIVGAWGLPLAWLEQLTLEG